MNSGIPQACYENSLNTELLSSSPYELTMEINELISPPQNTRKAKKFLKNPKSTSPPRPLNAFFLFRRDFKEKQKRNGVPMKLDEMSRLASYVWDNLSNEAKSYFDVLATWAKQRHDELYPNYKYDPKSKKSDLKKQRSNTHRKNNKVERLSAITHEKTCEIAIEEAEKSIENSFSDPDFNLPFFLDWGLISYPLGFPIDFPSYPYVSEPINNIEYQDFFEFPSCPEYGFEPINNEHQITTDQGFFVSFPSHREYVFDPINNVEQTTDQAFFDEFINFDQQPGANC
ncbi:21063_t:CDS:1 [Dentiscutata erythropus]|uniref:21063_t:CDS:1 n=1 Tax=Dentiscutata erythropus TaxID=1348616 RepID=A0A9N9FLP6_9GLOM|nr:21063_t:CDS:1 [Dentiscutata erythropus]